MPLEIDRRTERLNYLSQLLEQLVPISTNEYDAGKYELACSTLVVPSLADSLWPRERRLVTLCGAHFIRLATVFPFTSNVAEVLYHLFARELQCKTTCSVLQDVLSESNAIMYVKTYAPDTMPIFSENITHPELLSQLWSRETDPVILTKWIDRVIIKNGALILHSSTKALVFGRIQALLSRPGSNIERRCAIDRIVETWGLPEVYQTVTNLLRGTQNGKVAAAYIIGRILAGSGSSSVTVPLLETIYHMWLGLAHDPDHKIVFSWLSSIMVPGFNFPKEVIQVLVHVIVKSRLPSIRRQALAALEQQPITSILLIEQRLLSRALPPTSVQFVAKLWTEHFHDYQSNLEWIPSWLIGCAPDHTAWASLLSNDAVVALLNSPALNKDDISTLRYLMHSQRGVGLDIEAMQAGEIPLSEVAEHYDTIGLESGLSLYHHEITCALSPSSTRRQVIDALRKISDMSVRSLIARGAYTLIDNDIVVSLIELGSISCLELLVESFGPELWGQYAQTLCDQCTEETLQGAMGGNALKLLTLIIKVFPLVQVHIELDLIPPGDEKLRLLLILGGPILADFLEHILQQFTTQISPQNLKDMCAIWMRVPNAIECHIRWTDAEECLYDAVYGVNESVKKKRLACSVIFAIAQRSHSKLRVERALETFLRLIEPSEYIDNSLRRTVVHYWIRAIAMSSQVDCATSRSDFYVLVSQENLAIAATAVSELSLVTKVAIPPRLQLVTFLHNPKTKVANPGPVFRLLEDYVNGLNQPSEATNIVSKFVQSHVHTVQSLVPHSMRSLHFIGTVCMAQGIPLAVDKCEGISISPAVAPHYR